ncbi:GDP-Man:Man(3)GlcNAc(2)-PP-Dol alpha-1,2-mannosyltransferase [Plasmodiophora brassicae]
MSNTHASVLHVCITAVMKGGVIFSGVGQRRMSILFLIAGALISAVIWLRWEAPRRPRHDVAFFHPFCAGAGGGERVLWHCIKALQARYSSSISITIYCADDHTTTADRILAQAQRCFGLDPLSRITFVPVRGWKLIDPSIYPVLTLLLQSLGSVVLAFECLVRHRPGTFIDTTGFAFTYPLARHIFRCAVITYTHYPTISTDMLDAVRSRRAAYNNNARIAASSAGSAAKLRYYRAFAMLYGFVGRSADAIMVNSAWTRDHIAQIWGCPGRCTIVYPPCDTKALSALPLGKRRPWIVSVAQFRPEKNHEMQLDALHRVLRALPAHRQEIRLVLVGGVRNAADQQRVDLLLKKADDLGIRSSIDVHTNASFDTLVSLLAESFIGLHTMWNEHFGIGVVEYMAAGLVAVAHNSGGPRSDIIVPSSGPDAVGYLADDSSDAFADVLVGVLRRLLDGGDEQVGLRERGRRRAHTFSDEAFQRGFLRCVEPVLQTQ